MAFCLGTQLYVLSQAPHVFLQYAGPLTSWPATAHSPDRGRLLSDQPIRHCLQQSA